MAIFHKINYPDGSRTIIFMGKEILSYKKKRKEKFSESEAIALLKKQFQKQLGYSLNINNPQTLNEKIQWLKLYYRDPILTKCADKYELRNYLHEILGGEAENYLIPLLGVFDNPDEINFNELPNRFAIKVNWGSGQNIICKNKSLLDIEQTKNILSKWLKPEANHYFHSLEWAYKNIKPKIVVENYIDNINGLIDYKFFCFNGHPRFAQIAKNITEGREEDINVYMDYSPCEFNFANWQLATIPPKPLLWNEMIELAKKLSAPFPFVRIDLYCLGNQIKVGEFTFYHYRGMDKISPKEWDSITGSWLTLPEKINYIE